MNKINIARHVANIRYSKRYCQNKSTKQQDHAETTENPSLGSMARKYVPFREEDSEEILDVHEERLKYTQLYEERELEEVDPFKGLNLESNVLLLTPIAYLQSVFYSRRKDRCFRNS